MIRLLKENVLTPPNVKTSRADIVTEKPGPRSRARNVRTEMEAFQLFMDDSIHVFFI